MLSTLRPSDDDHLLKGSSTAILALPGHCKRRLAPPPAAATCADTGTDSSGPAEECPELMDEEEEAAAEDPSHSDCSDSPSPTSSSWEIVASPSGPTEASAATEAVADVGDETSTTTTTTTPTASGEADTDPEVPSPSPVPPLEEEEIVAEVGGEKGPSVIEVSPDREGEDDDAAATPAAPARRNNEKHNLGMVNLGNTCYLNSAVQMLVSMGDFVRDLEAYDEAAAEVEERMKIARMKEESSESKSDEGDETDVADSSPLAAGEDGGDTNASTETDTDGEKEEKKPSLRRELLNLARSLRLGRPFATDGDGVVDDGSIAPSMSLSSAVDPSDFKGAVDRLSCLFEGYRQQDSHEFLSTVLDLLQDEILDEEKRRREYLTVAEKGGKGEGEDVSTDSDSESVGTSPKSSGEDRVVEEGTKPTDDAVSLKGGCRCPREDSDPADGASKPERMSTSFSELGTEDISFLLGNDDSGVSGSGSGGPDIPQDVTVCTRRQEEKLKIPRTRELERSSSSSSSSSYATPTGLPLLLGGRMTTLATPGLFSSAWLPAPAKLRPVVEATTTDDVAIDDSEDDVPATDGPVAPGEDQQGDAPDDVSARNHDDVTAHDGSRRGPPTGTEGSDEMMTEDEAPPTTLHAAETCGAPDGEACSGTEDESSPAVSIADAAALRSPVEKHFGALVEVRLVCDSCSYTRNKTELYRYFSVDILPPTTPNLARGEDEDGDSRVATVEEGLRSFFAPEKIELKCEKCFCENATEYKEIVRLPGALLLHVKRFIVDYSPIRGVSFRKDKSRVEFGEDVDLNPYCCNSTAVQVEAEADADDEVSTTTKDSLSRSECEDGDLTPSPGVSPPSRYTLKSVVHHIGSSASCGHYTADGIRLVASPPVRIDAEEGSPKDQVTPPTYEGAEQNEVRRYENRWLHFDDGYVTEVSSHDEGTLLGPTAQGTAYMVMYELAKGTE